MRTAVDTAPEPRRQTSRARRWIALALGFLALVWLAFVFLPAVIGALGAWFLGKRVRPLSE